MYTGLTLVNNSVIILRFKRLFVDDSNRRLDIESHFTLASGAGIFSIMARLSWSCRAILFRL